MIVGKDVKPLVEKLKSVDWKSKADNVIGKIKEYAVKTGRVAVRPILQFYYVMSDAETTTMEKAMIYAAIIYTVSPISIAPQAAARPNFETFSKSHIISAILTACSRSCEMLEKEVFLRARKYPLMQAEIPINGSPKTRILMAGIARISHKRYREMGSAPK